MPALLEIAALVGALYLGLVLAVLVVVALLVGAVALGAADAFERWRVRRALKRPALFCGRCREPIPGEVCEPCAQDQRTLAEARKELGPGRGPWVSR